MVSAHQKALEKQWKDRCTVIHRVAVTNPDTKITDFEEKPLLKDQPCKLSFESLSTTDGNPVANISQAVKLFLSPDVVIPAGCKVIVTRSNKLERTFTFASSGEPGVFSSHQEIALKPFRGWA